MTFEEFVEALYKIGWRALGDAQHTEIRRLWDHLVENGLIIHKGGSTRIPVAAQPSQETTTLSEICQPHK